MSFVGVLRRRELWVVFLKYKCQIWSFKAVSYDVKDRYSKYNERITNIVKNKKHPPPKKKK
jgi:hypothetical protein